MEISRRLVCVYVGKQLRGGLSLEHAQFKTSFLRRLSFRSEMKKEREKTWFYVHDQPRAQSTYSDGHSGTQEPLRHVQIFPKCFC